MCCLQDRGPLKTEGNLAGTRGHMVGYRDTATGLPVFIVHFFMDQAGNISASGLPDPKWLYEDGIAYTFQPAKWLDQLISTAVRPRRYTASHHPSA